MRKLISFLLTAALCTSFAACSGQTQTDDKSGDQSQDIQQTESSSYYTEQNISDVNSQVSEECDPDTSSDTSLHTADNSYEQNVLYRADFEIPDLRGTGYTNIIDYYNACPGGKAGGTFANAGLMIHYRDDMDKDLSQADSLAFRTYRGIGLGSGKDQVFAAYGNAVIEPPFPEVMGISDSQHTVSWFVDYRARIQSGACVGIRFYFDQNDTVMYIDYGAVYQKYAVNINDDSLLPLKN